MERTLPDNGKPQKQSSENRFKIKDWFFLCVSHWKWFLISVCIVMGCAIIYLKMTPKIYTRTASILIKPDGKENGTDQLKELGIIESPSNVTNEIQSLQTSAIAQEIVRRLHLNINYYREGTFHKEVVYRTELPVNVKLEDLPDNEYASFWLTLNADGTVTLDDMRYQGKEGIPVHLQVGDTARTALGRIAVQPSPYYRKGTTDRLQVVHSPFMATAESVKSRISANLRISNSTIIDIYFSDTSPLRAEDVLNTLVSVYNENWVKDRNQITVSTNEFIKDRLQVIEQELGHVEQDISNYKSEHLMPDVQQVGAIAMSQATATEQEKTALSNQIYMIHYIRTYLLNGQHENQLLPSNTGIGSSTIGKQIEEYNEVQLRRNNHLANSSLQNPLVIDLDQHLATLRKSIIQSLDNELAILQAQQRNVQSSHNQAVSRIASNPKQAKYLLSVERQQKVKESLYLFLLQKREENELSQAFTAYNTRLIEPPHGSASPTSPVERIILLGAFILGIALPMGFLFAKEALNTTVRGRKDLEQMTTPFVGEIPLEEKKKKLVPRKYTRKEPPTFLVADNNRNIVNEAFRVVRTNLEFITGFDTGHHIIMLTSINPGSGKTFITANLSASLGIKRKKVLAIDLDLRKGSLSEYAGRPKLGVSNYLSGQIKDYRELIIHTDYVDILPCGTLPPNPTELLFSARFKQMLDGAREDYDFVFIDCPPVEIVADAAIIARQSDLTLFIVRAGYLERNLLPDIDRWYAEKKFGNMAMILNGTEDTGMYGYHKYGYHRYGYHYGYGNK